MLSLPRQIALFLTAVFISQISYYYAVLPDPVATHFNSEGVADGFMSKQANLFFDLGLLVFAFFIPQLNTFFIAKLPVSLINLPHREYWFADERRAETLKVFKTFFEWLSVAMLALFISINQLLIEANLNRQPLSDKFWFALGGFLLFMAVWLYKFITRFNQKPL